ncbi:TnsA endonuclease N-terminal domain-containing protein [Bacillus pseudomycoides]|uniref:TnsA endonuclease N-terminal domain-containing protein n=1 Tax=Bacillus TaxID=1386 RepID=UPI002248D5C2|nr:MULTISPECIES: TnsA endonuclease N-terminal domain-containing protein [Bacillus]MCX2827251.1 TnsA endonuclease N-terminal domain-containing protein [Bacillus sp. DHT2]MDR4914674.1 TnsA endonuclease N-terminal domain-containing protein [Bacillus pseudomycoides]
MTSHQTVLYLGSWGLKQKECTIFLSRLEYNYFLLLDYSKHVIDIREQYPLLDLELAMEIAKEKKIKYPTDSRSSTPYIMSTDFIITINENNCEKIIARTVKSSNELEKKRVQEKFEIERCYWEQKNIDWGIITERDVPLPFVNNLKRIRNANIVMSCPMLTKEMIHLLEKFVVYLNESTVYLEKSLEVFTRENLLKNGTALTFFNFLVFHHVIKINLQQDFKIHWLGREDFYVDREAFYEHFIS